MSRTTLEVPVDQKGEPFSIGVLSLNFEGHIIQTGTVSFQSAERRQFHYPQKYIKLCRLTAGLVFRVNSEIMSHNSRLTILLFPSSLSLPGPLTRTGLEI